MNDLDIVLKHQKFLERTRVNNKKDYYKHQEDRKKKSLENYYKRKNKV